MPQIYDAVRFRRTNRWVALAMGLVFVAGGIVMTHDGGGDLGTALWMMAYALLFALAQGAFVVLRYRGFKCPACAGKVEDVADWRSDEGSPVLKLCRRCDTAWRVGRF